MEDRKGKERRTRTPGVPLAMVMLEGAEGRQFLLIDGEPLHLALYHHRHLLFTYLILSSQYKPLPFDMSMSQSSSPNNFPALFNAALQDYKDKTGNSLVDHPLAKQLEKCDSVKSVSTVLEEQARVFDKFRDHGKLIESLKNLADILCSSLITNVLGSGINLVVRPRIIRRCTLLLIGAVIPQPLPPAKAIFTGIAILLAVCFSFSDHICTFP